MEGVGDRCGRDSRISAPIFQPPKKGGLHSEGGDRGVKGKVDEDLGRRGGKGGQQSGRVWGLRWTEGHQGDPLPPPHLQQANAAH